MSLCKYKKRCSKCQTDYPISFKGTIVKGHGYAGPWQKECCPSEECQDWRGNPTEKLYISQQTEPGHKICMICEHKNKDCYGPVSYTADHGERCNNGHLLRPSDFKITQTEVVESQLLQVKAGTTMGATDAVIGYGHGARLMRWAHEQGLLKPNRSMTTNEFWRDGGQVTEKGERWLKEYGGSERAKLSAGIGLERERANKPDDLKTIKANNEFAAPFEMDKLTNE